MSSRVVSSVAVWIFFTPGGNQSKVFYGGGGLKFNDFVIVTYWELQ